MNFSRIARQLNEDNPALVVSADSSEKATAGGEKQKNNTNSAKEKQKAQMAKQSSVPMKSDVSYTSEEARRQREMDKMLHNQSSDWRSELIEAAGVDAEGNHPYVDVMPFANQKAMEAKRQAKAGAKFEGDTQAQAGMQKEELRPQRSFAKMVSSHHDKKISQDEIVGTPEYKAKMEARKKANIEASKKQAKDNEEYTRKRGMVRGPSRGD